MLKRITTGLVAIGALSFAGLASTDAEAGIVFNSRQSRVLTQGSAGSTPFNESDSTDQTGTFDLAVEKDLTEGVSRALGTSTQHSFIGTLPPGVFHSGGQFGASASQQGAGPADDPAGTTSVSAASLMTIVFSVVDNPEAFRLDASFTNNLPSVDSARVFLVVDDSSDVLFMVSNGGSSQNDALKTGVLNPGTYRLEVEAAAGTSSDGATQSSSIDFDFVAGNGTVVPIPPAVLTGGLGILATIGASGWSRWRKA